MSKKAAHRQPRVRPKPEQRHCARVIEGVYEGRYDISTGTRQRLSLYLNRLIRDTGVQRPGLSRAELYLAAVTEGAEDNRTYDRWVTSIVKDVLEEHHNSPGEKLRCSLALSYTGRPNPRQLELIDALLALARFHLTLNPANLDLAQTIYTASVEAWRRSREQYKDNALPGSLDFAAGGLHSRLCDLINPNREWPALMVEGERKYQAKSCAVLTAWYGAPVETSGLTVAEAPEDELEEVSGDNVVDLSLWIQSRPRPVRNLLFAEKGDE
jgi:hypothetical protein